MASLKKKINLFDSVVRAEIERILQLMASDTTYNTKPSYSANSELYPDNLIPFVDKHLIYLSTHPGIDPQHYIANLRLMTRVR